MYVRNVYSRLARGRTKEIPTSLRGPASTGLSRARRCAGVGGNGATGSGAYSPRTARDWSVPRADWPTRLSDGIEAEPSPRGPRTVYTQRTAVSALFRLSSSPISLLSRWSLSSLRPQHRGWGFILFFASRFPNPTYFVSRSLARPFESSLSAA